MFVVAATSTSPATSSATAPAARRATPAERLTFYGMEKNATTIRLAKMNLAVHGNFTIGTFAGDGRSPLSWSWENPTMCAAA
jgi:N-6 DNA Methylase